MSTWPDLRPSGRFLLGVSGRRAPGNLTENPMPQREHGRLNPEAPFNTNHLNSETRNPQPRGHPMCCRRHSPLGGGWRPSNCRSCQQKIKKSEGSKRSLGHPIQGKGLLHIVLVFGSGLSLNYSYRSSKIEVQQLSGIFPPAEPQTLNPKPINPKP